MKKLAMMAVAAFALATGCSTKAFAELGTTREHSEQTFGSPISAAADVALYRWKDWYIMEWYNSAGRCEVSTYHREVQFDYATVRQMDAHNLPAGLGSDQIVELPSGRENQRIWQTADGQYRVTAGRLPFLNTGKLYYYRFYATQAGLQMLKPDEQTNTDLSNLNAGDGVALQSTREHPLA